MERIPRQFDTDEFRHEAVSVIADGGLTVPEVSRRLSVSQQMACREKRLQVAQ